MYMAIFLNFKYHFAFHCSNIAKLNAHFAKIFLQVCDYNERERDKAWETGTEKLRERYREEKILKCASLPDYLHKKCAKIILANEITIKERKSCVASVPLEQPSLFFFITKCDLKKSQINVCVAIVS